MATMTISLPDPMKDWIEARIKQGDYASVSDYVRDLVRRDRVRQEQPELTLDDLRHLVDEARSGGVSNKSVAAILVEAKQKARAGVSRE